MPEGIESYTPQCGYASMKKALDAGKRFTAVFAVSDSMAIGACKALYDAGKRIPEDVSVAGFDGIDMAYYYHPSITTIRQPVEEMSKETAKLLFDLIDGQAPKKQLVFAGELRSGESTQALG
ncbi:MAG: substrate-binding domain-containing protein [Lachnospiraceae bacterium]|nr:substrate-binding domain-containing protein [Lachnospiraceae bacterium]